MTRLRPMSRARRKARPLSGALFIVGKKALGV
jgi:hypothetical protein